MAIHLYINPDHDQAFSNAKFQTNTVHGRHIAQLFMGIHLLRNVIAPAPILFGTVEDYFYVRTLGHKFTPGIYEGPGYSFTFGHIILTERNQELQHFSGRFDTIEIAVTFWEALVNGDILPTKPACRELSLTEQTYAKQAAAGVAAVAKLGELEGQIAQLFNLVQSQGQTLQNLLTPDAATPVK